MNICVTGGSGFVGTNMLRVLSERYKQAKLTSVDVREPVYPIDGVTYITTDVRDEKSLHAALSGMDKIFHLAASIGTHESFDNPQEVFATNVHGTLHVLNYARQAGCEVFVAGMPGIWLNPYSVSKDAAVRLTQAYHEAYGVQVCSLRWYSIYGPYQYVARYNKAVPTFIDKALRGEDIPVYGDGNQKADFVYVDDAVTAAIDMLEHKHWGKVYQCATGKGTSVNALVGMITDACNSKSSSIQLPMRAGEPEGAIVFADIAPLQQALGTFEPMPLEVGLARTIDHMVKHPALD